MTRGELHAFDKLAVHVCVASTVSGIPVVDWFCYISKFMCVTSPVKFLDKTVLTF